MPLHLELGSDGHSFHGKAIVVNSVTGKHYSHAPIPMKKAEAQKRVIEGAMEEHGEHVTAMGKPAKRAHSPLKKKVSPEVAAERRARHEMKKLKPAAAKVAMLHEKMPKMKNDMSVAPLKAKDPRHNMPEEEYLMEILSKYKGPLKRMIDEDYHHQRPMQHYDLDEVDQIRINNSYRPRGMLSGKIKLDTVEIDFSPFQEFRILALPKLKKAPST
jgi:hypothetical protein